MEDLVNGKCEACQRGAPQATFEEINKYIKVIPEWEIIQEGRIDKLKRSFKTKDYFETIKIVNAIAEIANSEDHHPILLVEFNLVTVWWWTHKIEGLHHNDLIMAAKTDEIFA
jgi:4a-hydroxytetrahydrobiopterin dehydratase